MVAAFDWIGVGGVITALAGMSAAYAGIMARRTESRSAGREETQQSFDFQSKSLDRAEKRILTLEGREVVLQQQLIDVRSRMDKVIENHMSCERRLLAAEAMIDEMRERLREVQSSQIQDNTAALKDIGANLAEDRLLTAGVAADLAESHARADAVNGDEEPGAAADAASKSTSD